MIAIRSIVELSMISKIYDRIRVQPLPTITTRENAYTKERKIQENLEIHDKSHSEKISTAKFKRLLEK